MKSTTYLAPGMSMQEVRGVMGDPVKPTHLCVNIRQADVTAFVLNEVFQLFKLAPYDGEKGQFTTWCAADQTYHAQPPSYSGGEHTARRLSSVASETSVSRPVSADPKLTFACTENCPKRKL